ncbi:hypothetical protein D4764_19G0000310 [Takifugu flavidus]|uniref:ribonuclease H n=1 Tax=Takifugu flavidus TaxID=433684 RepID=A0A5C6NLV9_9TELE|nr:hypothetical protein D4764_19G0000310 [Takifugu flavidus]
MLVYLWFPEFLGVEWGAEHLATRPPCYGTSSLSRPLSPHWVMVSSPLLSSPLLSSPFYPLPVLSPSSLSTQPAISRRVPLHEPDGHILGSITHRTSPVQLLISGNHHETIQFHILDFLNPPLILGYPWLQLHNPHIDWSTRAIREWSSSCHLRCLQQAFLPACPPHSCSLPDLSMVPPEYQDFYQVFSAEFSFVSKDGSMRPRIDYHGLNCITVKNWYPLPLISSIFEVLQESTIFTKPDLQNAYHLDRIREGDDLKDVLRDMLNGFAFVYLDDILIPNTHEEHIHHVQSVLQRLQENSLFVKAEKPGTPVHFNILEGVLQAVGRPPPVCLLDFTQLLLVLRYSPGVRKQDLGIGSRISGAEVAEVVKKLIGCKAPRVDEIRPEFLKALDVVGLLWLTRLCNIAWTSGAGPLDWQTVVVVPLFKKGDRSWVKREERRGDGEEWEKERRGGRRRGEERRGRRRGRRRRRGEERRGEERRGEERRGRAQSTETHTKIHYLTGVNGAGGHAAPKAAIPEEQCGFRPGRGTMDQLYTLSRVFEGAWEFAQPVHMCFVDLEKAFNRVPRGVLLVHIAGSKLNSFPVRVGLHQGCPLSPILFITFMDTISRCSNGVEGVQFSDLRIGSLLFEDDVVLLASSARDLQRSLNRFAAACEAAGMKISTSKSEAMVLNRKKVECLLWVKEEILPQVQEFKYLGVLFTSEGRLEQEIDRRIAVSAVMRSLHRSIVVKRELSQKVKLSIYWSIFVPTLNYGHELWIMTERTRSRVQAAEMSFLRRVAGLSLRDRVRSSAIREELGVEPLLLRFAESQALTSNGGKEKTPL